MAEQERPPLWRVIDDAWWEPVDTENLTCPPCNDQLARVIRAVRQWLTDNGLVSTAGTRATPRSDARLLEMFEQEAQRAEAGDE